MSSSAPTPIERALSIFVAWKTSSPRPPFANLLSQHEDIAELLEAMREDEAEDRAAEQVLGDFRILREIGRGGMGVVYEATQASLQRNVALKVLPPHLTRSAEAIQRFQTEAALAAKLRHDNIVSVLTFGQDHDTWFFAMDLVEGVALNKVLKALHEEPPESLDGAAIGQLTGAGKERTAVWSKGYAETMVGIATQIGDALQHAHDQGVIHRDVKPSNILLRPDGRALLTDFGLSRDIDLPSMTRTGEFAGTPYYASPEQARGGTALDHRTDVFSLGATLYECLTLKPPFEGQTSQEVLGRIQNRDPVDPHKANANLAPDLGAITLMALEKDKTRRYLSAREFADDLRAFLEYRPIKARQITNSQRLTRWAKRNPIVASLSAALLFVFLGAIVFITWQAFEMERQLTQILRLSDVGEIEKLDADRLKLRAASIDDLPALDAWLTKAEGMRARWAEHRIILASLEEKALPYDDADRGADRKNRRDRWQETVDALDQLLAELGSGDRTEHYPGATEKIHAVRHEYAARIASLENAPRRTWKFATQDLQWRHSAESKIVKGFERLLDEKTGFIALVREWRDNIHSSLKPSAEARAAWQDVIVDIADKQGSPMYGGLRLTPQVGLVPLGKDPKSGLWEFAHAASGPVPARDSKGKLRLQEDSGIVFVLIPGGSFLMGALPPHQAKEGDRNVDKWCNRQDYPVHPVDLGAFFLSKFEMTQGQWRRLANSRPSAHRAGEHVTGLGLVSDRHPVENVTYTECMTGLTIHGLQLPTEAQWEYACRAGTHDVFYTGNDPASLEGYENGMDPAGRRIFGKGGRSPWDLPFEDGWAWHAPVGSLRANPWGLHDMLGNVSELCRDDFRDYGNPVRTGDGARSSGSTTKVIRRGGGFRFGFRFLRCAARMGMQSTESRETDVGLRAARKLVIP